MSGASTSKPTIQVVPGGGGNEVVILTRFELHSSGSWREGTESDCDVFEIKGLIANGYDSRMRLYDTTIFILFFGHVVNDILLDIGFSGAFAIPWAYDVSLVIFPCQVVNIDVNDVVSVVDPEHGVCRVPVDVVHLPASDRGCPHGAKEDVKNCPHHQRSHDTAKNK